MTVQNKTSHTKQAGFTIVELMIAISVLSVVLLLTTVGIVRVGEAYYKGITQANTQQAARNILNDIVENIEYGGLTGTGLTPAPYDIVGLYGGTYSVNVYCLGFQRYTYVTNYRLAANTQVSATDPVSKHVLWKDTMPNDKCVALNTGEASPIATTAPDSAVGINGTELLGRNMRLTDFSITSVPGSSNILYKVAITIMYGDDDLIDKSDPGGMPNWKCKSSSGLIGASFCAKSELKTTVGKRLR